MLVAVLNGKLTDTKQNAYIREAVKKYPVSLIEKLILDVQGEAVEVSYVLHRFRDLRKMGGCCIGEPSSWNYAKQAELRDTLPNRIE